MKSKHFSYTGALQTFIVPETRLYNIQAVGAAGSVGGDYNHPHLKAAGGKGAMICAPLQLQAGDELVILVGGKGATFPYDAYGNPVQSASSGIAGPSGGGTFVFRKIPAVVDNLYQFQKGTECYEALVVAAGGSGTQNIGQYATNFIATNGQGKEFYHPQLKVAYSYNTANPQLNERGSVLSIRQFILYDGQGAKYGVAQGGYGCGGVDSYNSPFGGGWAAKGTLGMGSWSIVAEAVGEDGYGDESADGYCFIGPAEEGVGRTRGAHLVVNQTWKRVKEIFIAKDGGWRQVKAYAMSVKNRWKRMMRKELIWGNKNILTIKTLGRGMHFCFSFANRACFFETNKERNRPSYLHTVNENLIATSISISASYMHSYAGQNAEFAFLMAYSKSCKIDRNYMTSGISEIDSNGGMGIAETADYALIFHAALFKAVDINAVVTALFTAKQYTGASKGCGFGNCKVFSQLYLAGDVKDLVRFDENNLEMPMLQTENFHLQGAMSATKRHLIISGGKTSSADMVGSANTQAFDQNWVSRPIAPLYHTRFLHSQMVINEKTMVLCGGYNAAVNNPVVDQYDHNLVHSKLDIPANYYDFLYTKTEKHLLYMKKDNSISTPKIAHTLPYEIKWV